MSKSTYQTPLKRRLEGKTNYARRLALLKSGKPRLVVRRSNNYLTVQLIEYKRNGDNTLAEFNSKKLDKFGWNGNSSIPSGYLTGYALGKKAVKKGVKEAVLDIGLVTPVLKSKPFSVLKGVLDAGIKVPYDEKALPEENRLKGKSIEDYAKSLSEEKFNKRFSDYAKKNLDVKNLSKLFEEVKGKIDSEFS